MMNSILLALQSTLFVTTAFPYGAVWFLVWLVALVFYLSRKSAVVKNSKRKRFWIFLACVPLFLMVISVSKIKTEFHFRKACAEDSGLFVYKKISLGPEYWLAIDPSVGPVTDNEGYVFTDGFEINQEVFNQVYLQGVNILSLDNGLEMSSYMVSDKRTGQVLGEIKDYFAELTYFLSQRPRKCRDLDSHNTLYLHAHKTLVQSIFSRSHEAL
jgi:hypothetical protein